jgi:hypothetical protein
MQFEKIKNLDEQLAAEKDSREVWINRYELEHKKHTATHSDLMAAEAARAEIYLKHKD